MKFDHYRCFELSLRFLLVSFTSEFSSKLHGVILSGSVDDVALPVITKKKKLYKRLQKPPESTSYASDSCGNHFKKRLPKASTKRHL